VGLGTLELSISARVSKAPLVPALRGKGRRDASPGTAEVDFTFTSMRSAEDNLAEFARYVAAHEDSARRSEEYFAARYPVDRGEYLANTDPEDLGDIEAFRQLLATPPPELVPLAEARQLIAA